MLTSTQAKVFVFLRLSGALIRDNAGYATPYSTDAEGTTDAEDQLCVRALAGDVDALREIESQIVAFQDTLAE